MDLNSERIVGEKKRSKKSFFAFSQLLYFKGETLASYFVE